MRLAEWLAAIEQLEPELLSAPPLEPAAVDAACVAINAGGHLRLVIDLHPLGETRLRVRVIERGCAWWLTDSWGRVAPAAHVAAEIPRARGLAAIRDMIDPARRRDPARAWARSGGVTYPNSASS